METCDSRSLRHRQQVAGACASPGSCKRRAALKVTGYCGASLLQQWAALPVLRVAAVSSVSDCGVVCCDSSESPLSLLRGWCNRQCAAIVAQQGTPRTCQLASRLRLPLQCLFYKASF